MAEPWVEVRMGRWQRWREERVGALADRADAMADRADQLSMAQPGTPLAIEAAEQSVTVARKLLAAADTLDNRRRLAWALRRRSAAYMMAEDFVKAAASVKRCWGLCLQLLDATATDPAAYDETVLLVVKCSGTLVHALARAGRRPEAERMADACTDIATRTQGPRARQARALQSMAELSGTATVMERAYLESGEIPAGLDEAIALARDSVEVLRGHASEGPYDVVDLARMLEVLHQLYWVAGQRDEANVTLEEAISVAETVANRGPTFAKFHREFCARREVTTAGRPKGGNAT